MACCHSANVELEAGIFVCLEYDRTFEITAVNAGGIYVGRTFLNNVQVDQFLCCEIGVIQIARSAAAHFFFNGKEAFERRMRKVMLMEAVGQLKDADQKFVILKTLEGYDSSEIALLLAKKWRKQGIVKYDNLGNAVVPSAGCVDVRRQRAKAELKRILGTID